jgi:two-component system, OmpR family, sensor histidine kinase QseC
MKSLRLRIFALLAAMTIFVWSAAAIWIYVSTRARVEHVLDRRLAEAAQMVASLATDRNGAFSGDRLTNVARRGGTGASYARQLSCQIWSLEGELIGQSSGAPTAPLALGGSGFSERSIDGETWRVFSHVEPKAGVRVLVGDNLSVRRDLVNDLITGLLLPAIAGLGALAFLIWAGLGRGLVPLRRIAQALERRNPDDASPLGVHSNSTELQPVIRSLDGLFQRIETLRAAERHFIASAAHELQTPLAGLRTHAQIALISEDPITRSNSLQRIEASVDRTARMVRQLLDLAREEAGTDDALGTWTSIGEAVEAVRDELSHALERQDVRLESAADLERSQILLSEEAVILVLRNLVENAINHSPEGGTIRILSGPPTSGEIWVEDDGSGIPEEELERVKERFVRGRRARGAGSGLGLSIVELILERGGGTLRLINTEDGGLRAVVALPRHRLRDA